jgi:hypothetical protein
MNTAMLTMFIVANVILFAWVCGLVGGLVTLAIIRRERRRAK